MAKVNKMGYPRKDDIRVYFEKKDKTYILVYVEDGLSGGGSYYAIGSTFTEFPIDSLGSVNCPPDYLRNKCKRVSWNDIPFDWQVGLKRWLDKTPEECRGLWKIGENK